MDEQKGARLSKLAKEFNVGIATIIEFLKKKGFVIENNPNTKITQEIVAILQKEYSSEINVKKESERLNLRGFHDKKEIISILDINKTTVEEEENEVDEEDIKNARLKATFKDLEEIKDKHEAKVVGRIDLGTAKQSPKTEKHKEEKEAEKIEDEKTKKDVENKKVKEKIKASKVEESDVVDIPIELPEELEPPKVVGKIDLDSMNLRTRPPKKSEKEKEIKRQEIEEEKKKRKQKQKALEEGESEYDNEIDILPTKENIIRAKVQKLSGPTVVGKIDLPEERDEHKKLVASSSDAEGSHFKKRKRKRIKVEGQKVSVGEKGEERQKDYKSKKEKRRTKRAFRQEVSEEDVQKQIKDTLARLTTKGKSKASKYRREKREAISQRQIEEQERQEMEKSILKVTEFVTVSELATMMNVPATDLISTCMSLGLFVSINQRLDAETIVLLAEEFNYKVEFVSIDIQEAIEEVEDAPEDLLPRPPIVTVMGHVDHGKTKLLDFVRNTNVVAGEAGGITQHIGAYSVKLNDGRIITFLDTPGHEAFTAMRARGAKVTDVAIIVVAADDGVMPQTREAINHAQAAGVPIVFAINKIDKPTANPDKIKEELAKMNLLVEDWGGKYQSQEISAKTGLNIEKLLDKVLLEAELKDLKANPNRNALGTVIESSLDKGRGYIATILVETGTLKIGDLVLAGTQYGRIKAMYNERGKRVTESGPSTPVLILGLNGAPQAGDEFHVLNDEKEAKDIATKREQLQREQGLRTRKHITLDEIGRRIAIGNFKELNVIVKGDVDGSVEALSDSLIKLSTPEIQVNIIHKAVGQISESDVLLAAASNAVIIGFQVRPSMNARRLAEKEQIDVRLYSIIYNAIEELKDAMEGMLSPEIKEEIVATLEIKEVFKITKVGTVAGCIVKEGKIQRNTKVRIIRDGIVVYTGDLASLKHFKDDAKEVVSGQECGLNIENFNDIKVGDIIEGFKETEIKKKL